MAWHAPAARWRKPAKTRRRKRQRSVSARRKTENLLQPEISAASENNSKMAIKAYVMCGESVQCRES
jgi:hypothetical protein